MSLNDRMEEASRWCRAQPSGTVTLPAAAVADALWEAAVPGCDWTEYVRYDDDPLRLQTVHGACDGCSCPCHQEVGA